MAELVDALVAEVAREAEARVRAPDRLLAIDEAAATLGLGRTSTYGEIAAGRLRSIKVGRRRLVPAGSIAEYIARTPQA